MRIRLRALSGQTHTLEDLAPDATIALLKARVETDLAIPASLQRLVYAGRELAHDDGTLASYGIPDDAVMHLIVRQNSVPASAGPTVVGTEQPVVVQVSNVDNMNVGRFSGENVFEVFSLSRFIMLFAILDFFFIFLAGLLYPILLVGLIAPLSGYYGAKSLKPLFMIPYVMLEVLIIVWRVYLMIEVDSVGIAIFYGLGVLLDMYIIYLVIKFSLMIRKLTSEERNNLLVFNHPLDYAI